MFEKLTVKFHHWESVDKQTIQFVGIDGCRFGWLLFFQTIYGEQAFTLLPSGCLIDLLHTNASIVMIDMPIGIPEWGYRQCDLDARKLLGKYASRVFLGACSGVFQARQDYHLANGLAKQHGKGLSKQLFNILPKIEECYNYQKQNLEPLLYECHPELVFTRLNDGIALPPKISEEGRHLRVKLIEDSHIVQSLPQCESLSCFGFKFDDLLDAVACFLCALNYSQSVIFTLPSTGQNYDSGVIHY